MRGVGLLLRDQYRLGRPAVDRDVGSAERSADRVGQLSANSRLAGHRGDAEQLATRLGEQIRQRHRIVDVAADVRVQ